MAQASQADVIATLLDPAAYPHPVRDVTHIETHISHVLLAGDFAYKIKKPVSLGFLDYSTLAARKHLCEEEVRLNARLCDDVYLDVVALASDGDRVRMDVEGEVVEYAVKMRRVPADRMLSEIIERDEATTGQIQAVARKLAGFHGSALTDESIAHHGSPAAIRLNWDENVEQTRDCVGQTLSEVRRERIVAYVDAWLRDNAALIDRRANTGRVRDIHGDLRSDAIVIEPGGNVCVMDCIEFSDRIRCGDVAGDIGFLAMDLEFRGRRDLVDELIGAYLSDADDDTLPAVLDFYRCYRAYVRGKVEWLTRIGCADAEQRAAADARGTRYFELAETYATSTHPAGVVVMAGLSGTGKSFIAGALAGRLGAAVLSSDRLRRAALGLAEGSALRAERDAGAYSREDRRRVYARMLDEARAHLSAGRPVVLDATYSQISDRAAVRALAADLGLPFFAVEVVASDGVVRARLAARARAAASASDAGWEVYVAQKTAFEPLSEIDAQEKIRVDGSAQLTASVDLILERLVRR